MGLLKKIVKKAIGAKEFEFKVAGVTFKNGRRNRQTILRDMKFGNPGFETVTITLEKQTYEGRPAIAVFANGEQIGYVPKELSQEITNVWKNEYMIQHWEVKGSGEEQPRGCVIKAIFR